jgi:hypothetical protein
MGLKSDIIIALNNKFNLILETTFLGKVRI